MARNGLQSVQAFVPIALAASNVGTWERDPKQGTVQFDAVMAHMFGFDEEAGAAGVSLSRLRQAIHPDDREFFTSKLLAQADRGGLMIIEYRVRHSDGTQRWVLVRGRYEPIQLGHPIAGGRGIVIDITESKLDGHVEDRAFFARQEEEGLEPQHRAVDHALALYRETLVMGPEGENVREAARDVLMLLAVQLSMDIPARKSNG